MVWSCISASRVQDLFKTDGILNAKMYHQLLIHHLENILIRNGFIFQHDNPKHPSKCQQFPCVHSISRPETLMKLLSSERALRITPRSLSRGKKLLKGYVEVIVSNIDFHLELYQLCFCFIYCISMSLQMFRYISATILPFLQQSLKK